MADALLLFAAVLAAVAFVLAMARFVRGPLTFDRVVAFDVVTIVSITGIVLAALVTERVVYLDVALVYALMSFLGVVVVARHLEKGL